MTAAEFIQRAWRRWDLLPGPGQFLRKCRLSLRGARIGQGTWLPRVHVPWPHQLSLGRKCIIEPDVFFKYDGFWKPGPSIQIGDRVFIGRNTEFNICSGITIADDCLIASGCTFVDSDHGTDPDRPMNEQPLKGAAIVLEENVWIGAQCMVLKGVRLGRGAVIGAGSVVTKSVPAGEVWAGVPARQLKQQPLENAASDPFTRTPEFLPATVL
jgi:acetyltransferase-like isoleucine patch superfamily enzyme